MINMGDRYYACPDCAKRTVRESLSEMAFVCERACGVSVGFGRFSVAAGTISGRYRGNANVGESIVTKYGLPPECVDGILQAVHFTKEGIRKTR